MDSVFEYLALASLIAITYLVRTHLQASEDYQMRRLSLQLEGLPMKKFKVTRPVAEHSSGSQPCDETPHKETLNRETQTELPARIDPSSAPPSVAQKKAWFRQVLKTSISEESSRSSDSSSSKSQRFFDTRDHQPRSLFNTK